jgi:hypothetical protein
MAISKGIKQLGGIFDQLSGTYNGIQFCKNGVIRVAKVKKTKK